MPSSEQRRHHSEPLSAVSEPEDNTHTHTHPFNGPFSVTTRVGRYQKGKTNLDFTEARDSEWHWHQLGHMQVCTLLQTDNHASTSPLSFLQAGCPSCRPTNSVKALKREDNILSLGTQRPVSSLQTWARRQPRLCCRCSTPPAQYKERYVVRCRRISPGALDRCA